MFKKRLKPKELGSLRGSGTCGSCLIPILFDVHNECSICILGCQNILAVVEPQRTKCIHPGTHPSALVDGCVGVS